MQKYRNNLLNNAGSPVQGASVLVVNYPSGSTATIYSDNGVTVAQNPLTTDNLGGFSFYALDGHYQLNITGPGIVGINVTDILLNDSSFGPDNIGPTASRPAVPTLNQEFFDTTLGEPIWCTQVSPPIWVNAAGVAV